MPRPDSSLISPVNWPAPMRAISASALRPSRRMMTISPLQHEPGGRVTLADIEDDLAAAEGPRRPAGEAPRRFHLGRIEHGKHLLAAVIDNAHDTP